MAGQAEFKAAQPHTLIASTKAASGDQVAESLTISNSTAASRDFMHIPSASDSKKALRQSTGKRASAVPGQSGNAKKKAKTCTGTSGTNNIDEYLGQSDQPMDLRLMQQVHASQGFFTAADLSDSDSESE